MSKSARSTCDAGARARPLHQCRAHPERGGDAPAVVDVGDARLGRRSVGLAGKAHDTGQRLDGVVVAGPGRVGPGLAVAGQRARDHRRVHRVQRVVAQPELRQHPGAVVVDDHVGVAHEVLDDGAALLGREAHADRNASRCSGRGSRATGRPGSAAPSSGRRRDGRDPPPSARRRRGRPGPAPRRVRRGSDRAPGPGCRRAAPRRYAAPGSLAPVRSPGNRPQYPISWRISTAWSPLSARWCSMMRCASCGVARLERAQDPGVVTAPRSRPSRARTRSSARAGSATAARAPTTRRRDPPAWLINLWNSWFHFALSSGSVAATNALVDRRAARRAARRPARWRRGSPRARR